MSHELTFGVVPCLIEIRAHPAVDGSFVYLATCYVIEEDGHALRPVGDAEGEVIELPGGDEDSALSRASNYLEGRFGPSGSGQVAKAVTRHELQPPMKEWHIVALDNVARGQHVVFIPKDGAKPLIQTTGVASGTRLGKALEDIPTGRRGWIREMSKSS
jgi:hypothetical protein